MAADFFLRNLKAYRKRYGETLPGMVASVERARTAEKRFERVAAGKGPATLRGADAEGRVLHIHSAVDPVAEAKQKVQRLAPGPDDIVLFFGVGLGYLLQEMLRSGQMPRVALALEPFPEVVAHAFEAQDLTQLIGDPRILILAGREVETFRTELIAALSSATPSEFKMETLPHVRADQEFTAAFRAMFDDLKEMCIGLITTQRAFHEMNRLNMAANYGRLIRSADPASLANLLHGMPGLIVGPGPSLEKNRWLMRECAERCVIIALGAALRALSSWGIRPHLAAFIDPQENVRRQINGIAPDGVLGIATDFCHPRIAEHFSPDVLVLPAPESPMLSLLSNRMGRYGTIATDISVAVFSLHLARHLGLQPIAALGIDFMLRRRERYAGMSFVHGMGMRPRRWQTTVWGTTGPTEDDLLHYHSRFSDIVRRQGIPIVDLRETGAPIEGAKRMSGKEFLLQTPRGHAADAASRLRKAWRESSRARVAAKRDIGNAGLASLRRIKEHIEKARAGMDSFESFMDSEIISPDIVRQAFAAVDTEMNAVFREAAWPLVADPFAWNRLKQEMAKPITMSGRGAGGHAGPWKARREFIEAALPFVEKVCEAFAESLRSAAEDEKNKDGK